MGMNIDGDESALVELLHQQKSHDSVEDTMKARHYVKNLVKGSGTKKGRLDKRKRYVLRFHLLDHNLKLRIKEITSW